MADNRPRFEEYQATQGFGDAPDLKAPLWASFVGVPGKETLFVGLYAASLVGALPGDRTHPIPATWSAALSSTRGIYLLSCPRTREQYVGMASGSDGFMGRWQEYFTTGHGGNVGLKSRDPSDYRVSILETVGSAATANEILALETRWKGKLLSREMGLNRN